MAAESVGHGSRPVGHGAEVHGAQGTWQLRAFFNIQTSGANAPPALRKCPTSHQNFGKLVGQGCSPPSSFGKSKTHMDVLIDMLNHSI